MDWKAPKRFLACVFGGKKGSCGFKKKRMTSNESLGGGFSSFLIGFIL